MAETGTKGWMVAGVMGLAMLWKLMCVLLRARRSRFLASFSPREDAYTVRKLTNNVEFPFLAHTALQFALFRTFAVPSISKILTQGGTFAANAVKRSDDTEALLQEFTAHHVDSDRGTAAIRRLNFIHGQFPSIKNEDFLYVLALFIQVPVRWISEFGYRELTTSEKIANYISWRDIRVRMGIKNIPEDSAELEKWQIAYEEEHMVYAATNRKMADITTALFLQYLPKLTWPVVQPIIFAMLDDRLRVAFGYPEQPKWLQSLARWLLKFLNGTCVAWFHPPRPLSLAVDRVPVDVSEQGDNFDINKTRKFAFDRHGSAYPDGYRIPEVGRGNPGSLGGVFEGELLCPLSDRYFQTPWPPGARMDNVQPAISTEIFEKPITYPALEKTFS